MLLRQNYTEMSNHDSSYTQAKIYRSSSCGVGSNPLIFCFRKSSTFNSEFEERTDRVTHWSEVGAWYS